MGVDDGSTDGQTDPNTIGLRGVKCLENMLALFRGNTGAGIVHADHRLPLPPLGADQQLSRAVLERAHGFDRIQHQVQYDLLELNAVTPNGKRAPR